MTAPTLGAPRLSDLHVIQNQLQVSTVRLHGAALARAHGLDGEVADRVATVVAEMASNILRHAKTGHIILRPVGTHGSGCIELLALDKGPGIADMTRAMRETRTIVPGQREPGIPAIRRMSNLFDIYSHPGRGTAMVAHVGPRSEGAPSGHCVGSIMHECVGAVCIPVAGEEECGDDWIVEQSSGQLTALLVDGLGHGPGAAAAAQAAIGAFGSVSRSAPERMIAEMHNALRHTRGAALSVTVIDQKARTVHFSGVGNVDGRVIGADTSRQMMPHSGIVGHTMPRVQTATAAWPHGARMVLHSDGVSSRWRADHYPGLLARHPALLAGILFRDFGRPRDDATVLVLRDLPVPRTS